MNAEPFGRDLHRPECVHCTAQGDVFVSDWRGGVTRIRADGSQQLFRGDRAVKTNGFAILPDRSFLLAHLGDDEGGVFRLTLNGELSTFLDDLPPTSAAASSDRMSPNMFSVTITSNSHGRRTRSSAAASM